MTDDSQSPEDHAGARVAVVDLGTNTTRLLVGDVRDGRVEELERRTEITRLGQGVDATGVLTEEAQERVFAALADYRGLIDRAGAGRTVAVATSAIRDADNGEAFRAELRKRFGIEARTIPGNEEARLTFLGATSGRAAERHTLVLDIGGGSTELVIGAPGRDPEFDVSTQAGAVRQTERHLAHDPPSEEQLSALADEVHRIIDDAVPGELRAATTRGIAVAGTATSLAAISQELDPYDPARVDGFELERVEAERILARLAALRLEERRKVTGLHPERAPTIVAGAAILVEAMRAFGLESIETSEADILHGAALEAGGRSD